MDKKFKLEKISLRIFYVCMVLCATLFLIAMWTREENKWLMSFVITFFVVGLANFLIWLPIVIYKLIDVLKNNRQ